MAALKFLMCLCFVHAAFAKGSDSRVECTPEVMKITVPMDGDRKLSYLEQLKGYSPCKPEMDGQHAIFVLDLQDVHACAIVKVLNRITGKRTFYHKVVIETVDGGREVVTARCELLGKRAIAKRDLQAFPLDFDEPDVVNITRYTEGKAPEPVLGAVVKQNGKQVSGEISVSPGTPLSMEIFLDEQSAPVYGLLVNYMHVTDTVKQQETIILNGCSVDPYLFDNFLTSEGDVLAAKFRAFKFPDTSYVQFKGTVSVCLDKCQGIQCSNGVTGFGRRRRAIAASADVDVDVDLDKVFEVSLTTFIKVDNLDGDREAEDVLALIKNLNIANQQLGLDGTLAAVSEEIQDNKLVLQTKGIANKSYFTTFSSLLLVISIILALYY